MLISISADPLEVILLEEIRAARLLRDRDIEAARRRSSEAEATARRNFLASGGSRRTLRSLDLCGGVEVFTALRDHGFELDPVGA